MKIRALALGVLVVSLGGAQLIACGDGEEGEPGLDGGSSGSQQSSGAQGASSSSSGQAASSSSSGQGTSSSSSSGANASSSSSGANASSSSSGETTSSSGGEEDSGASSSGGDTDAGTSSSGGESDAGNEDAGADAGPQSDDPFDPTSCAGAAWPSADALASLNGAPFRELGRATMVRRSRVCPGGDVEACGPWGAAETLVLSLLTYSGGVVTDYKAFSFPTILFLYQEAGLAKYSIRHVFDVDHDPNDVDHGIRFSSADSPMTNSYPRIYVWDPTPAPNRYQDLEGRLGDRATLFVGPHCARYVAPRSYSDEIAALYRF